MKQERQQQRFGGLRVAIAMDSASHVAECLAVRDALEELGAVPLVLAASHGSIRADPATAAATPDQAQPIEAHSTLQLAEAEDLDALVVPGGSRQLATDAALQKLALQMERLSKPMALSGTGVGLLLASGLARGRRVTGPDDLAEEAKNAGAQWVDAPAVNDGMLVSGRGPDDVTAFVELLLDTLARHRLPGLTGSANDIISATGEDG